MGNAAVCELSGREAPTKGLGREGRQEDKTCHRWMVGRLPGGRAHCTKHPETALGGVRINQKGMGVGGGGGEPRGDAGALG